MKKYRVEGLVGEGGTGIVLAATHVQLGQRVALKFLRRALASEDLRTRFSREARAMTLIESDHVVSVLDAGALDDGSPYIVLEHLEGRDLARVLKEDGPLPVEEAVDCVLHVCEALRHAHAAGIVHRDLKPANLLLTRQRDGAVHVKVVDFGISKFLDPNLTGEGNRHDVTAAHDVLGSPRFMAPEQLRSSRDVDGRADLWSVGAVLFQLITGKYAFEGVGNAQATIAVLTRDALRLSSLAPHVPPELDAIVARCLEKDLRRRFQTAEELAMALAPFASSRARESIDLRVLPPEPLRIPVASSSTNAAADAPASDQELPRPRRSGLSKLAVLAVVLGAVVFVSGGLALFRARSGSAARATGAAGAKVTLDAGKTSP